MSRDAHTQSRPFVIAPDLQLVGVWMSVAQQLASEYPVVAMARSTGAQDQYARMVGDAPIRFIRMDDALRFRALDDWDDVEVIRQAMLREERYGERFAMIIAQDRGLGKGYLFNADGHPDIAKAWWPHARKVREVLREFLFWEWCMEEMMPRCILSTLVGKVCAIVARHHHVPTIAVWTIKYGDRQYFMEDEYHGNHAFFSSIRQHVAELSRRTESVDAVAPYALERDAQVLIATERYSYAAALRQASRVIRRDTQKFLTGHYHHHATYPFLAWLPFVLRKPRMYRYVQRHGTHPRDLRGHRFVFFPLHLEPEVALLVTSPECTNSLEVISWISKSLPADALLVVKEHPNGFGTRTKQYYRHLLRMGNVVLAHPNHLSEGWMRSASIVATLAGTVGIEAVYQGIPVLSFGKRQAINLLPSVRYANSFDGTREAIDTLLAMPSNDTRIGIAKHALYRAQLAHSFELSGLAERYKSFAPEHEIATRIIGELRKQRPVLFTRE